MVYKMQMLHSETNDPDYQFILGTNNGIAVLKINKTTYEMSLSKEVWLAGKVVNHLLARGSRILAFVHDHKKYFLIDRKSKEVVEQSWFDDQPISCTGIQWAPGFHPTEMSIVFLRDSQGVHMLNTQTWHVSTLINMAEGAAKFPDLSLLRVVEGPPVANVKAR